MRSPEVASVKTMVKRCQGRQCGHKTCAGQKWAPFRPGLPRQRTAQSQHAQHGPSAPLARVKSMRPFHRTCAFSLFHDLPCCWGQLSSAPCGSVSWTPEAEFHSLLPLSWKCLVTDPATATWHPLSRRGSAALTKKVIFQPSGERQEPEWTC